MQYVVAIFVMSFPEILPKESKETGESLNKCLASSSETLTSENPIKKSKTVCRDNKNQ
jgi:hypothetical protein